MRFTSNKKFGVIFIFGTLIILNIQTTLQNISITLWSVMCKPFERSVCLSLVSVTSREKLTSNDEYGYSQWKMLSRNPDRYQWLWITQNEWMTEHLICIWKARQKHSFIGDDIRNELFIKQTIIKLLKEDLRRRGQSCTGLRGRSSPPVLIIAIHLINETNS